MFVHYKKSTKGNGMTTVTKVAYSGTHCTYKTTRAYRFGALLKREGLNVIVLPEVARQSPFPINQSQSIEGTLWIIAKQVQYELEAVRHGYDMIICDRCVIDPLIYFENLAGDMDDVTRLQFEAAKAYVHGYLSTYDQIHWLRGSGAELIEDGVRDIDPAWRDAIDDGFKNYFLHATEDQFHESIESAENGLIFNTNKNRIIPHGYSLEICETVH